MDRGDPDAQARDLTFEFEVKEQDRWLPIANGWFSVHRQLPITVAPASKALQQHTCAPVGAAYEVPPTVTRRHSTFYWSPPL